MPNPWSCIAQARHRKQRRLPFTLGGEVMGSVAQAHLDALRALAPEVEVSAAGVALAMPRARRDEVLERINRRLHEQGLVRAWRNETYAVVNRHGEAPRALIERAAARFWGTLTFGAHANGWVAGADGRPSHLWIARRSYSKPTDPGRLDNLVGGGVPHGQTPFETLVREGWEEAGLPEATMRRATGHAVLVLDCDIAEGLQREHLFVHDLQLRADEVPCNQDGEVAELRRLPVLQALEAAAAGEMTVDAALVTLDFGLRHSLLAADEGQRLAASFNALKLD